MKELVVRGRGKPYGQWHVQEGMLIIKIDDDANDELWYSVALSVGDVLAEALKPESVGRAQTPALKMLGAVDAHISDGYGCSWLQCFLSAFAELYQAENDVDPDATAECVAACRQLADAMRDYSNARRAASEVQG